MSEKFIGCTINEVDDSYRIIEHKDFIFDAVAFDQWCVISESRHRESQQERVLSSVDENSTQTDILEKVIIQELYDFRLESVSLIECMQFIHKIG